MSGDDPHLRRVEAAAGLGTLGVALIGLAASGSGLSLPLPTAVYAAALASGVLLVLGSLGAILLDPALVIVRWFSKQGHRLHSSPFEWPLGTAAWLPLGPPPSVPACFVARRRESQLIRELVLKRKHVAIVGPAGAGKSVLAQYMVADYDVGGVYDDGIVWIPVGRSPDLLKLQSDLIRWLDDSSAPATRAEGGVGHLARLLRDRSTLLILDDVWEMKVVRLLAPLGARCGLIVTTRDREIARSLPGGSHVDVAELEDSEAIELLRRLVTIEGDQMATAGWPVEAQKICGEVGNLALGVAVCGAMVVKRGSTDEAWRDVLRLVQAAGLDLVELPYPPDGYEYGNLRAAIEVSIDSLDRRTRTLYRDLAVFADRGPMPLAAVNALWHQRGVPRDQVDQLLGKLVDRSLAQRVGRDRVVLHDLQYDAACRRLGLRGLVSVHRRLLDGYRSLCRDGDWSTGPASDRYFWDNLAYHMVQAHRARDLNRLLLDFSWLRAKLGASGPAALLADYTHQPPTAATTQVQRALRLSAPLLAGDPDQLPGQLIARLMGSLEPAVQKTLHEARVRAKRPWLRPLSPALTGPGPLEQAIFSHPGGVVSLAITPDGTRLVSCGLDGSIDIRDLASGERVRRLEPDSDQNVVAVAADSEIMRVVSGGDDGSLTVWEISSGRVVRKLEGHHGEVTAIATACNEIISGSHDGCVTVWDVLSGRLLCTLEGHVGEVTAVAATFDGARIVSSSDDGTIRVWDRARGQLEYAVEGQAMGMPVAVTPDGSRIVGGREDGTIRIWGLSSGQILRTLEGHAGRVNAIAITPDGSGIVSGGADDTVRVWGLESGQLESTLVGHSCEVESIVVARTPMGIKVISGDGDGTDGTICVWDLASARAVGSPHDGRLSLNSVAVTPDRTRIVAGGHDGIIRVWDLASSSIVRTLTGHADSVNTVDVTRDGKKIVSAGHDGIIRVWDLASGSLERTLEGHKGYVSDVAVTPDGGEIVSTGGDGTVRVWDVASGRQERMLEGNRDPVDEAPFAPANAELPTGDDEGDRLSWIAASIASSIEQHLNDVHYIGITPDGAKVVSGRDDGTVSVWGLPAGQLERTLVGSGAHASDPFRATSIVIASPHESTTIVSADSDGSIRVWDLASGRVVRTPDGQPEDVTSLAVAPTLSRFVSGSWDGTIRIWDLATAQLERTLQGTATDYVGLGVAIALAPDGSKFVSWARDGTLRVWDLASGRHLCSWSVDAGHDVVFATFAMAGALPVVAYGDTAGRVASLALVEEVTQAPPHTPVPAITRFLRRRRPRVH
jgi:WD40 repeat protein